MFLKNRLLALQIVGERFVAITEIASRAKMRLLMQVDVDAGGSGLGLTLDAIGHAFRCSRYLVSPPYLKVFRPSPILYRAGSNLSEGLSAFFPETNPFALVW